MGKSSPKPPPAPNPGATAAAQTATNKDTAYWNAVLNNVNQITPYGNLKYEQTGGSTYDTDAYQRALADYNSKSAAERQNLSTPTLEQFRAPPQFTSTVTLSPEQQKILDSQTANEQGLQDLGTAQLSRISDAVSTPYSFSGLPAAPNTSDITALSEQGRDAILSRLDPQFAKDESALRTRLINQGITQGSEAYNREFDTFNQAKNDARAQAILQGQTFGGEEARQQLALRNQAIQEYNAQRNAPLNEYSALTSGTQVQNPQFQSGNYQGAAPGDYQGAVQNAYNANLGRYNSQVAQNNATTSGLFGLGGSVLGAAGSAGGFAPLFAGLFSDELVKENIIYIGEENGHRIYEFDYVWGGPRQIGVIAQEIEETNPDAVIEIDGMKFVDYAALGLEMRVA